MWMWRFCGLLMKQVFMVLPASADFVCPERFGGWKPKLLR
jgi:hypothetical protein